MSDDAWSYCGIWRHEVCEFSDCGPCLNSGLCLVIWFVFVLQAKSSRRCHLKGMPITASDISMQIYPVRSLLRLLLFLFACFFLFLFFCDYVTLSSR